jgi:hypothetical protein
VLYTAPAQVLLPELEFAWLHQLNLHGCIKFWQECHQFSSSDRKSSELLVADLSANIGQWICEHRLSILNLMTPESRLLCIDAQLSKGRFWGQYAISMSMSQSSISHMLPCSCSSPLINQAQTIFLAT